MNNNKIMDGNFHSEINMEEMQHPNKNQREDYQVFYSTIQVNEFDKKINHNNNMEFHVDHNENSFPTYSKLGNSNAKIDSIDYFDNKINTNKIENSKTKNTLAFNYSDVKKDNESLFSYNNEEEIKFNDTVNQEHFEIFQHSQDNEMKNYLVENNIIDQNNIEIDYEEQQFTNKSKSNKKLEIETQVYTIDDLSNYIIKEKEEKKDL